MSAPSTSSPLRVGIAGAGLLGRLTAWQLARRGCRVDLFEAGSLAHCAGAARTAAAMISPLAEVVDSERGIYDLGTAGLPIWQRWMDQLGGAVGFSAPGSLVVAHTQDTSQLQQFAVRLQAHLGSDDSTQWLNRQQLQQREPDLSSFSQALYLPGEAHLDNRALLDQLLQECQRLSVALHEHTPVTDLQSGRLHTPQGWQTFDCVLDCRGIGAQSQLSDLRGVRGEVLWVETSEVQLQHPVRFMHPRYKLYVVPKPDQRFIIGATEIESEDRSPISLRSSLELSSALYALNPAFAEARVVETDVNLRPALHDNLPRITGSPGLYQANGLYRHGYLLAPAMVESLVALALGETPADFGFPLFTNNAVAEPC